MEPNDEDNFWYRFDLPIDPPGPPETRFQVAFTGTFNKTTTSAFADIAIDDITFTPKCR